MSPGQVDDGLVLREQELVAIYARLYAQSAARAGGEGAAVCEVPEERCPYCGGMLCFRKRLLDCQSCGARVEA